VESAKEVRRLQSMSADERIASSDAEAVANLMVKKKRGYVSQGHVVDSEEWKGWVWLKKK
jgi:hypothetical protein